MKDQLQQLFQEILIDMGIADVVPDVTISDDIQHGEYTTNAAMKIAAMSKSKGQRSKVSPMDIALQVKEVISRQLSAVRHDIPDQKIDKQHQKHAGNQVKKDKLQDIDQQDAMRESVLSAINRVEVVSPGFINVFLGESFLSSQLAQVLKDKERYGMSHTRVPLPLDGETGGNSLPIMVEFAHPNTHKAFHIGHLRNITTGEGIVRLLEAAGYDVIRSNYQGDVGMHIAKALYALVEIAPYKDELQDVKGVQERVEFLGKAYAVGSKAFEEDESAKERIKDFNYLVYAAAERFAGERGLPKPSTDYLSFIKGQKDMVDTVFALWKETRQWSLDYFETIYRRVGTHYDRYYFESECLTGVDDAHDAVKNGVLEESDGAIIFPGKKHGLDTRVFVNSLGLPTYEAKELALSQMEATEFGALSHIIHCVGPEQSSFFAVTFKAEELIGYVPAGVQYHLAYGWVRLKHGKMSSRSGNVILGEWLLDEAKKSIYEILDRSSSSLKENPLKVEEREDIAEKAAIAAVKYAFLRVSTNQEIAFDLKESVSFDGDSGPYLLYSYARCRSVLRRSASSKGNAVDSMEEKNAVYHDTKYIIHTTNLNVEEHFLARLISYFPEVVADAARNLAPNTICSYLFRLAQAYNLFYQKHTILGGQEASKRLALTTATAQVLKNGLHLLGIETVERM